MDLTPQTLRQVEFREKLRGYHPDDVDDFLEEVAVSLEALLTRLQAAEAAARAAPAEAVAVAAVAGSSIASEIGVTEETIRRTLLLAQKTADAAIADAEESAHQILSSAQDEAQRLLDETKASVTTMTRDAKINAQTAITELEQRRASLERDLGSLQVWASQQRDRLRDVLSDQMRALDVWLTTGPTGLAKPPAARPPDAAGGARPADTGGLSSPGGQGRANEGGAPPRREFPSDRGTGPASATPRIPSASGPGSGSVSGAGSVSGSASPSASASDDVFGGPRGERPPDAGSRPGFARTATTGPRRRPDVGGDSPIAEDADEGSGPGRHAARSGSEGGPAIPLGPAHDEFGADPGGDHPDEVDANPDVFDQETTARGREDDGGAGGQRGGRLFKRN
jgi:cell division initiation protein